METIPWYKSAILRQQVVQLLVAGTALVGVNTETIDLDATVASIFAGIAAVVAIWTFVTRLFKPAPNMTTTAANTEARLIAEGKIPPKQGGFLRVGAGLLAFLAAAVATVALAFMSGCVGTKAAYKAADSLPDTAYVVAEHYAAVLKEAADLAQSPTTSPEVKAALKEADLRLKPLILGDPSTGLPGLQQLAQHYRAVKDAQSQADLQRALDAAVLELAKLINAVKSARR